MSESNPLKINPNTADIKSLTQIPGIGAELAQRIIAARPFESLVELSTVSGISSNSLARYLPYLTLSQENEEEQPGVDELQDQVDIEPPVQQPVGKTEAVPAGDVVTTILADERIESPEEGSERTQTSPDGESVHAKSEADPEVSRESPREQPIPKIQPASVVRQNWVTPGQVFALMFVSFVFTLILGIVLSLGILASLNRGHLQYATPDQIQTLATQVNGLDNRTSAIEQDIQGIRERLDNMETLSTRVGEIEKTSSQLTSDMTALESAIEDLSLHVNDLADEINGYSAQINTLQSQLNRFDDFLEGLRVLLDALPAMPEGK